MSDSRLTYIEEGLDVTTEPFCRNKQYYLLVCALYHLILVHTLNHLIPGTCVINITYNIICTYTVYSGELAKVQLQLPSILHY